MIFASILSYKTWMTVRDPAEIQRLTARRRRTWSEYGKEAVGVFLFFGGLGLALLAGFLANSQRVRERPCSLARCLLRGHALPPALKLLALP